VGSLAWAIRLLTSTSDAANATMLRAERKGLVILAASVFTRFRGPRSRWKMANHR
jgi:hypothetical protein